MFTFDIATELCYNLLYMKGGVIMSNNTKQVSISLPANLIIKIDEDAKNLSIPKSTVVSAMLSAFYHSNGSLTECLVKGGVING